MTVAAPNLRSAIAARTRGAHGLSTIEMVTVIALTGVLSVGLAGILRHPMQGYAAVSRRAELVDLADLAVHRMSRDLRLALPNSVRIDDSGSVLELFHVAAGARYREQPGTNANGQVHTATDDWLSYGGDSRWNLLGRISGLTFAYGTPLASGMRVAVYPTSSDVWSSAAADANPSVITASSNRVTLVDDGDEDQINLSASHRFDLASPSRRLYLVDGPVTYLCDSSAATLWRIDGYAASATQPTSLAVAPLSSGAAARTAEHVERCSFAYVPGSPARSALVTIEIVLASDDERIRLLEQVAISNAP